MERDVSIAKELGRKLVISRKTAHLLKSLEGDQVGLPDPVKDGNIEIYHKEGCCILGN